MTLFQTDLTQAHMLTSTHAFFVAGYIHWMDTKYTNHTSWMTMGNMLLWGENDSMFTVLIFLI